MFSGSKLRLSVTKSLLTATMEKVLEIPEAYNMYFCIIHMINYASLCVN